MADSQVLYGYLDDDDFHHTGEYAGQQWKFDVSAEKEEEKLDPTL